jgi:hypothetical protein
MDTERVDLLYKVLQNIFISMYTWSHLQNEITTVIYIEMIIIYAVVMQQLAYRHSFFSSAVV